MADYSLVRLQKLSYRECWRMTQRLSAFLNLAMRKTFAPPEVCLPYAHWSPDKLDTVERDGAPEVLVRHCDETVEQCKDYTLRFVCYHNPSVVREPARILSAAFITDDRRVVAELAFDDRQWPKFTFTCISELSDGLFLTTTTAPQWVAWLNSPPQIRPVTLDYGRFYPEDVLQRHYERIAGVAACRVEDAGELLRAVRRCEAAYHTERGLFIPSNAETSKHVISRWMEQRQGTAEGRSP